MRICYYLRNFFLDIARCSDEKLTAVYCRCGIHDTLSQPSRIVWDSPKSLHVAFVALKDPYPSLSDLLSCTMAAIELASH